MAGNEVVDICVALRRLNSGPPPLKRRYATRIVFGAVSQPLKWLAKVRRRYATQIVFGAVTSH